MDFSEVRSAANSLNIDDRLRLVEELWDGIASQQSVAELTQAQRAEVDRRLAEDESSPDDVVPWAEVDAEIKARLNK